MVEGGYRLHPTPKCVFRIGTSIFLQDLSPLSPYSCFTGRVISFYRISNSLNLYREGLFCGGWRVEG